MDEKDILARARRGDTDAFEQLVTCYEKRVYAIALRSTGCPEDAADITQEAFVRAWRSVETFRGESGFSTWIFRITINLCVDFARRKATQVPTRSLTGLEEEERVIPDPAPTPEEHLENAELRRELSEALSELSEEHRQIVLLRDVSGLSYTEIAETLKISEGTVKSRLSRGRLALRETLHKRGNLLHSFASKYTKGGAGV